MAACITWTVVSLVLLIGLGALYRHCRLHTLNLMMVLYGVMGIILQLYPVGEFMQQVKFGPLWAQNHLSDVGSLQVFVVVFMASATYPTRTHSTPDPELKRQMTVRLLTVIRNVSVGVLVLSYAYEVVDMIKRKLDPPQEGEYYSTDFDWSDILAYTSGMAPVLLTCAILTIVLKRRARTTQPTE